MHGVSTVAHESIFSPIRSKLYLIQAFGVSKKAIGSPVLDFNLRSLRLCMLNRDAMTNLALQHQLALDQTRDKLAEEYRSLVRKEAAAFEQVIADLEMQLLSAETVRYI